LFERHAKEVYNYCFRATGNWSVAEDLLSLTFLEAWRRRDKNLPEDKIRPWLLGVAVNVVRNRRRSERRFAEAMKRVPAPPAEPDFTETSESRLDDERRMREAMALLSQLSASERDVFLLCTCMGASYDDAAFALGIPVGTVRSRLSRGRAHLRELESRLRT
jgi:RNA polymerase sigma-70 factor (ECF subfamily)